MLTKLIDRLSIGNWQDAERHAPNYHVVTVAVDSPFIGHEHFKLVDGPGNPPQVFHAAVAATIAAHKHGRDVLVHCVGGRSRSAAVCVAAITALQNRSVFDAYEHVITKHSEARIHPYLSKFLTS